MNIFYIPSWYPSPDHPLSGIFIQEQIEGLTDLYPHLKAGISIWGQKDENRMLYLKKPFNTLAKVFNQKDSREEVQSIKDNAFVFYRPAFTWTKRVANGNLSNILKANDYNFRSFEKRFGRIHLIHAFVTFPGGYIAMKLAEKYKIPYMITEEMSPFRPDIFMNLKHKIHEQVILPLRNAAKVIAVSTAAAQEISRYSGSPVSYIPNLVDETFFIPPKSVARQRKFYFFTLGRMVEQKGIPILLEAISKLDNQNVLFRIGGDGEHLNQYKQLSKALSIENIEWLGALDRTQARQHFQECNAFILPSLHESMGVVFAEAIACGKPIIATKCGGPESIVNEDNGLLAEVGDSDDLAHKISWMIDHYDRYKPEIIRADFMNRFSQKVVGNQIMELYKKVMV